METTDWKQRLVPFDYECIRMVESLTEIPTEIKFGGSYYFFEADYSQHPEPDYVNAVFTAIEGRYGKRLIKIEDDADRKKLIVEVKFSQEKLPQIYTFPKTEPVREAADKYHTQTVWAMEVVGTIECARRLAHYTGGGNMEIPEEGPAKYYFVDDVSGVWKVAMEGEFIVKEETKPYRVITKAEFEKLWSKK